MSTMDIIAVDFEILEYIYLFAKFLLYIYFGYSFESRNGTISS